jgi:hypothetical protein
MDFQKYVTLNRMQSIVQPVAMNTNENMLICGMSVFPCLGSQADEFPSTDWSCKSH